MGVFFYYDPSFRLIIYVVFGSIVVSWLILNKFLVK